VFVVLISFVTMHLCLQSLNMKASEVWRGARKALGKWCYAAVRHIAVFCVDVPLC
jgi:hypothetical protein